MQISPAHVSWIPIADHVCEYASAVFGIWGTALMSRRFAPQIVRSMLFALTYPLMVLLLQGRRVRQYFISKAKLSEHREDSLADMTLGLNLLFWGFFLQLVSLILK